MPTGNTMDAFDWSRREELVAAVPNAVDVGIGADLTRLCGMETGELAGLFRDVFDDLVDGGANATVVHSPRGDVVAYVLRRKRHVDAGTRADLEELGWGAVCDYIDARLKLN